MSYHFDGFEWPIAAFPFPALKVELLGVFGTHCLDICIILTVLFPYFILKNKIKSSRGESNILAKVKIGQKYSKSCIQGTKLGLHKTNKRVQAWSKHWRHLIAANLSFGEIHQMLSLITSHLCFSVSYVYSISFACATWWMWVYYLQTNILYGIPSVPSLIYSSID